MKTETLMVSMCALDWHHCGHYGVAPRENILRPLTSAGVFDMDDNSALSTIHEVSWIIAGYAGYGALETWTRIFEKLERD